MNVIGYVFLMLGVASVLAVAFYLRRLRATLTGLEATAADVAERVHALPPDLVDYLGEGKRPVLTAELLNPVELAAEKTWVARPMSALTPNLLRDLVYKQAATQAREQLAELNIEVDVAVHRAP